jgi:tetratricopeptide (TPR) repeat protein
VLADFAAKPVLRKPVTATNPDAKLPVVAVIASEGIPASGRAAFVQRLKQSGEFSLIDPASIAATTRETDLQLTGEMAAPLNGRSVWLAVDSVVVLSAGDGTLHARQCDVLSGEPMRQARIPIPGAPDDSAFDTLAGAFLQSQPVEKFRPPTQAGVLAQELSEPDSRDTAESAFAKTLRLVKGNTNIARYWVALSDCYGEWDSKMWLLDQAVNAVERDKAQPDAPFWLGSALWRKRRMSSWAWLYSHAWSYSEHPLTKDFARLLEWFPNSAEARTALEEATRKSGGSTYCDPKDGHFMAAVFTNVAVASRRAPPEAAPLTAPTVTAAQRLARLKELVRQGDHAKAWRLADSLLESKDTAIHAEAQKAYDELFKQLLEEDQQIKAFNAAFEKHENEAAWKIGRPLLNNIQRKQRLALIESCGQLLKARKDVQAYFQFVFEQAEQYKEDFDLDPVTGSPATVILDFEPVLAPDYSVAGAPVRAQRWTTSATDMEYARLMGDLAEEIQAECRPDLAARVFEAIRRNNALPMRNRLTAAYDLAQVQYQEGKVFEALELLKELLQQTEGTGLPIARKLIWTSGQVEEAAFDLLRKIRLYADEYTDFTKCCGEPAPVPAPDPALAKEMNQFFADLWKQFKGGVGGDNQGIREKLLGQKDRVMPVLLYKLWKGEDAQMLLAFCGQLGTNADVVVPYLPRYVCYSGDFPQVNNALNAFGGIGKPAARATPLLILAAEGTTSVFNAEASLRRIGPAPRSVVPYLARLLYHQNPGVARRAAKAIMAGANLDATRFSEQDLVESLRKWWEEEGSKKEWKD